jgi:hypothetical protein
MRQKKVLLTILDLSLVLIKDLFTNCDLCLLPQLNATLLTCLIKQFEKIITPRHLLANYLCLALHNPSASLLW